MMQSSAVWTLLNNNLNFDSRWAPIQNPPETCSLITTLAIDSDWSGVKIRSQTLVSTFLNYNNPNLAGSDKRRWAFKSEVCDRVLDQIELDVWFWGIKSKGLFKQQCFLLKTINFCLPLRVNWHYTTPVETARTLPCFTHVYSIYGVWHWWDIAI